MKKLIFISLIFLFLPFGSINGVSYANTKAGYILLQVEKNGEAFYVYPKDGKKYYLGRPSDAFAIMKKLALGAKHDFIVDTEIFPTRLSGMILLDVEENGEAYYIYPKNLQKYYLGRPQDAFRIMRELGLGATNEFLAGILTSNVENQTVNTDQNEKIFYNVPFAAQAPFGDWSDQRQQDGCEEASALMTVRWARGETLSKQETLENVLNASDYLLKTYGEYRDISVEDTVNWIYKDYFNYDNVLIKENISLQDIIDELKQGNLIVTQMNGQLLFNPYYTAPGPEQHMLVVVGYDPDSRVFITNDPGTRYGQSFEYDEQVFYNAIRDYYTGYYKSIENVTKSMIIVSK